MFRMAHRATLFLVLAVVALLVSPSATRAVSIPGDLNGDRRVDMADLVVFAGAWGSRTGMATYSAAADFNQDGSVDILDLMTIADNWGISFVTGSYVVFAYNDLGMHCMNQDFSEFMILPPYNVMHASVIQRGGDPRLLTSGVTVNYAIPGNTHSADKTNFWQYAQALLSLSSPLPPDIGLTGSGLTGSMVPSGGGRPDWVVTGIPITPIADSGKLDPYCLARVSVTSGGQLVAQTNAVVPVSWEISCDMCHTTPGISVGTDILRKHDMLHPEVSPPLEQRKPVMCGSCHAQAPLGTTGQPGVETLSRAMHHAHSPRMAAVANQVSVSCYACHPGKRTECLRDVHFTAGMNCFSCHTSMDAVADPVRQPWATEPRCDSCHQVPGHQYEQANTLYRNSIGHNGVPCEACHGSPHAITPTVVNKDNYQAIALQGHSGTINTCIVCHTATPGDSFNHTRSD